MDFAGLRMACLIPIPVQEYEKPFTTEPRRTLSSHGECSSPRPVLVASVNSVLLTFIFIFSCAKVMWKPTDSLG